MHDALNCFRLQARAASSAYNTKPTSNQILK